MGSNPAVLLVLFEGLADTVVDSTVLDQVRQLSQRGGKFEIWAFCCSRAIYRTSRERIAQAEALAGATVRLSRAVRPAFPFSLTLNRALLWLLVLWRNPRFDVIHARTDYSAWVCSVARLGGTRALVWDCRGDAVAEAVYRAAERGWLPALVNRMVRYRAEMQRRGAGLACDAAIFVSKPLAKLCEGLVRGKPTAIIPCTASEDRFFFDAELRRAERTRLGYHDADRVFVYCGSLASSYEYFDETVALFGQIARQDPRARLLVVTPETAAARHRAAALNSSAFTIASAGFEQVNRYLNAADIGLMLRARDPVNTVACPTKFAEYCLTGLPVMMGDHVGDTFAFARDLGLAVDRQGSLALDLSAQDRVIAAARACALLGKAHLAPRHEEIYRSALRSRFPDIGPAPAPALATSPDIRRGHGYGGD